MTPISRRSALKTLAAVGAAAALPSAPAEAAQPGWVSGHLTGARALVETLQAEGTLCVFGIPGAQENELWDAMKACNLPYLLATQEGSASYMADGAARATGQPGVLCVVPGPGITNALTGIGEALLDSVPLVCVAGDVGRGAKYRPFQVHELPNARLLEPVCKAVYCVEHVAEIPLAVRKAFQTACAGEPGPAAVVVPYNLLIESFHFRNGPLPPCGVPFDEVAFAQAVALLSDRHCRVGLYVGMGCMDHAAEVAAVAELLQAPVATSVSGKGSISDCHPLAVGWGYGAQGTVTAEKAFQHVDVVLAIGVRFSEVSTGFYCLPQRKALIQVDASAANLGKVFPTSVCVHADAGVFLAKLLECEGQVRRAPDANLAQCIHRWKQEEAEARGRDYGHGCVDPLLFYLALRQATSCDALVFVDVSMSEHWGAEVFAVQKPRTYFNPTDNQAMGWSVPAALGAQRVMPARQVVTVTGDGCFLMTAMEVSTAAREGLPVKFFVLDDQAYHYMQVLQQQAYKRTTATMIAHLDYPALAQALGVGYAEIVGGHDLEAQIREVLCRPGPVLTRVRIDYGKRPCRWINAVRKKYTGELSTEQKVRFAARLGARSLAVHRQND